MAASESAKNIRFPISEELSKWWEGSKTKNNFPTAIITFSALFLAIYFYKTWRTQKLPPGPRSLPLLGNLLLLEPDLHRCFAKLAKIYGPIMKLQLGTRLCVVVTSPALAKEVLRDHDAAFANRDVTTMMRAVSYGGVNVTFSPNGPHWRMVRKVCMRELLSSAALESLCSLRRREVHQLVKRVYDKIGCAVSVKEEVFFTMLYLIMGMLWGDTVEGKEKSRVGSEIGLVLQEIAELVSQPNVSDLFPVLAQFDIQGIGRKTKGVSARIDRISEGIIDRRLKMDAEGGKQGSAKRGSKDLLRFFLEMKEAADPKAPFTKTHLKALFLDLFAAGTDSASVTVEWAMTEMLLHPDIMNKAKQELEEVVGMKNIVEEFHLPKLHYLGAVVKEVLRMHTVAPLLLPRCPSQSGTVGGFTVPEGAQVFLNVWAMHRDPESWDNPLEFQPERFLVANSTWDYSGNDFRYLPFGSGRRMCAGISMAERMVMYVLASLLHTFAWRLPEGTQLDLTEKFGIVLKKKMPLLAIPTPRLPIVELYM